jgi:hypothetical protein
MSKSIVETIIKSGSFKPKFSECFLEFLDLFDEDIDNINCNLSTELFSKLLFSIIKLEIPDKPKPKDNTETCRLLYDRFFYKSTISSIKELYYKYDQLIKTKNNGSMKYFLVLQEFQKVTVYTSCFFDDSFINTKLSRHEKFSQNVELLARRLVSEIYKIKVELINRKLNKYLITDLIDITDLYIY